MHGWRIDLSSAGPALSHTKRLDTGTHQFIHQQQTCCSVSPICCSLTQAFEYPCFKSCAMPTRHCFGDVCPATSIKTFLSHARAVTTRMYNAQLCASLCVCGGKSAGAAGLPLQCAHDRVLFTPDCAPAEVPLRLARLPGRCHRYVPQAHL